MNCCVCSRTETRLWRVATDNLRGGTRLFRAVRCAGCGTVRQDPFPDDATLARAYAPDTYARDNTGGGVGERLDLYHDATARRAHAGCGNQPGRVLDVGCGDGRFLAALALRGWHGEGVETDAAAAALARRRTGFAVHVNTLEAAGVAADAFDLVSLVHVLEHVPDPRATLRSARRALKPGGVLFLALPNAASVEASLFGASWYHLDLPRHLWGFTPRSLARLLDECGFVPTSTSPRYLPFLFAPQSVRIALGGSGASRQRSADQAATVATGTGGRLTRLFATMLHLSEVAGRSFPGEIMEWTANKPGGPIGGNG